MRIIFIFLFTIIALNTLQAQKKKSAKSEKSALPEAVTQTVVAPVKPTWQSVGLSEMTINAIGVSRTNKNLLFVANDDEGVFRSSDGGSTWEKVALVKEVGSFVFERLREKVVYVVTPQSIYLSTDEGKTFVSFIEVTKENTKNKITCLNFDESMTAPAKAALIGTKSGLVKTLNLNKGNTFSKSGLEDFEIYSIATSVSEGEKPVIFAATTGGIYTSQNYGLSWTPRNTGIPQTVILQVVTDIKKPRNVYAVTEKSGVFRSEDGGETWSAMAENISQLEGFRLTSAIDGMTNRSIIYMTNYSGETYQTDDNGKSWKKIGDKLDASRATGICIGMSSLAPTTIYVGTLKGVFKYEPKN